MTYVNETSVIVTSGLFMGLALALFGARLVVKKRRRAFGWDDVLAAIALFFSNGVYITMIAGAAHKAIGGHQVGDQADPALGATTTTPTYVTFAKYEYVFQLLQPLAIGFIRLSILSFYARIFRGKWFTYCNWTLNALTIAWTIAFCLTSAFGCGSGFHYYWSSYVELTAHCVNLFHVYVANAISDTILDIVILLLPMPFIARLNKSVRSRIALAGVFLIGTFAVAAGIVRLAIMVDIDYYSHPGQVKPVQGLPSTDNVGITSILLFWQEVQIGVAMITSCLLTLGPLWHRITSMEALSSMSSSLRRIFTVSTLFSSKNKDSTSASKNQTIVIGDRDSVPVSEAPNRHNRSGYSSTMQNTYHHDESHRSVDSTLHGDDEEKVDPAT